MKKKKPSKAKLLRSWRIESPPYQYHQLRYKNPPEKGVFWYWFSLEVRQRDVDKYGVCISCGKPITVKTSQAGHFIAAQGCGRDLLFDQMNVHAECPGCNGFDPNHLIGYERGLEARYGPQVVKDLKERYWEYKNGDPVKDWSADKYAEKIKSLQSFQQAEQHDATQK
jgi:predicted RNA-binding Zn-ribbon protein involved in translation (DUF1610 family)